MAASLVEQFQQLFGTINPGTLFGLDIGAHSIKVCELSGNPGKYKIEKFGVFTLSEAALIEDEVQKPSEIIEAISEAVNRANIKSKSACLGLFGPNTMTKRLSAPEGTKEEIEDHIMWEAEQYITFGADDSKIDFALLGENEGGGKDALVAAAKIELIDSFADLVRQAKLSVQIVDLNVIALSNIFEEVMTENLEELSQGTLLIDFGAQTTKIIVYKRGGPIFTKEIPIGGSLVTEEIQRQMGVSYEEAEDLKTTVDSKGNLPQEVLNIIEMQVDNHVSEVRKNINFYVTHGSAEKVNQCYVTGGSSLLPGLIDKLSAAAGIPVERLDVLSAFKFNDNKIDINPNHLAAIAPVAIGLAMRKNS